MGSFHGEKALGGEYSLEAEIWAYFGDSVDGSWGRCDPGDEDGVSGDEASAARGGGRAGFWEAQESLLEEVLSHGTSTGGKLRRAVRQGMQMARETSFCNCHRRSSGDCNSCLRQVVVDHLRAVGYDAAFCTSSWKPTLDIPGGMHEYIDVVIHGDGTTKDTRYVIEPEFRAEFELVKGCDNYRRLVARLPEFYVGRPEHLMAVVGIACDAGKRSMKDSKMHMGPWRKRKFVMKKWAGSYRRSVASAPARQRISGGVNLPTFMCGSSFCRATTVV